MHLKPTPQQEAAVRHGLQWHDETERLAGWLVARARMDVDETTVRGWLFALAAEGKVKRVGVKPERWGLA